MILSVFYQKSRKFVNLIRYFTYLAHAFSYSLEGADFLVVVDEWEESCELTGGYISHVRARRVIQGVGLDGHQLVDR